MTPERADAAPQQPEPVWCQNSIGLLPDEDATARELDFSAAVGAITTEASRCQGVSQALHIHRGIMVRGFERPLVRGSGYGIRRVRSPRRNARRRPACSSNYVSSSRSAPSQINSRASHDEPVAKYVAIAAHAGMHTVTFMCRVVGVARPSTMHGANKGIHVVAISSPLTSNVNSLNKAWQRETGIHESRSALGGVSSEHGIGQRIFSCTIHRRDFT